MSLLPRKRDSDIPPLTDREACQPFLQRALALRDQRLDKSRNKGALPPPHHNLQDVQSAYLSGAK